MTGMFRSETDFSRALVAQLRLVGDACQHHDASTPGLPDVSFALPGIGGWIELKYCDESENGGRVLTGLTRQQQRFLELRGGLMTYCFLAVATEVGCYLFHHSQLEQVRRFEEQKLQWPPLRLTASWYRPWRKMEMEKSFTWDGLFRALTGLNRQ